MKIILEVKDSKVDFLMELLKNFNFVKAKPLTPYKAEVLEGIKDAVEEVNLAKQGKTKLKSARDLLNEI